MNKEICHESELAGISGRTSQAEREGNQEEQEAQGTHGEHGVQRGCMSNKVSKVVDVLGTPYTIEIKGYSDDPAFAKHNIDGYCEHGTHRIVIGDLHTFPGWEDETEEFIDANMKHTLAHELVHGILNESGIQDSAHVYDGPWSKCEEMIDFWAIQGPKIYKIWEQANAI